MQEDIIEQRREAVEEAFEGRNADVPAINDALKAIQKQVTLAEFVHTAALVSGVPSDHHPSKIKHSMRVGLLLMGCGFLM